MRTVSFPAACLLTLAVGLGCNRGTSDEPTRIIGVKAYEHEGDLSTLFSAWKDLGVNTAFTSEALQGREGFQELADENGITTFVILPIFFNPEALDADSSLYAITDQGEKAIEEWVRFVCPSREAYREAQVERIKTLIREQNPDGLSLDFIRHFVFWEKVYPDRDPSSFPVTCFDTHCLTKFQADTQITLPDRLAGPAASASWMKAHHRQAWAVWKSQLITSMVAEIASEARALKPDIMINVHTVPWREEDFGGAIRHVAGQDVSQIAPHTDYISPMTYAPMVRQDPAWVHDVVEDVYRQTGADVLPSIQVRQAHVPESVTPQAFGEALRESLKPPSRGVVFWSWEALVQEPEKMAIARTVLDELTEN